MRGIAIGPMSFSTCLAIASRSVSCNRTRPETIVRTIRPAPEARSSRPTSTTEPSTSVRTGTTSTYGSGRRRRSSALCSGPKQAPPYSTAVRLALDHPHPRGGLRELDEGQRVVGDRGQRLLDDPREEEADQRPVRDQEDLLAREPLLERLQGVVAAVGDGLVLLTAGEGPAGVGALHLLDGLSLGGTPVDLYQARIGAAEGEGMVLADDPRRLLGPLQR